MKWLSEMNGAVWETITFPFLFGPRQAKENKFKKWDKGGNVHSDTLPPAGRCVLLTAALEG